MAGSVAEDEHKFCSQEVLDTFKMCLSESKEVYLEHYLAGWNCFVKFLNSLGSVFSYNLTDVVNKIKILTAYLEGENGSHYVTIQSMVKYELDNGLVDLSKRQNHPESGCRTLLRLHRALRWLELFLERVRTSTEDSKLSVLCAETYNESLSQHHFSADRSFADMAFDMLPERQAFFEVMNVGSSEQAVAMVNEIIPHISEVNQKTEELYAQHNLLDLP